MEPVSPLSPPGGRSVPVRLAGVIAFSLLIALCARVALPMVPVPMTLQTWAVLLAGVVLGPTWGCAAVLLYLATAFAGLPVLSDGASGPEPFMGPTAGYLVAFAPAAWLAGRLSRQDRINRLLPAVGWLTGLHLLILALGWVWLARGIGAGPAMEHGVLPFLPGAVVKSVLVVAAAWALARLTGLAAKRFRPA